MRASRWSVATRNAKLNAVRADFDDGYVRIYDGEQPESPDAPIPMQQLLAELRFQRRAFGPATNGMLITTALIPDSDAKATGKPRWYRCFKADGVTGIHDGTIGPSDANGTLAAELIVQHAVVECAEFIIIDAAAA